MASPPGMMVWMMGEKAGHYLRFIGIKKRFL